MITGVHALLYAKGAEATRAFFKNILRLPSVDAGRGWLIFALPPAEIGVHPTDGDEYHELHLMCDNVRKTVAQLKKKGVRFTSPIKDRGYGLVTAFKVPGGGELGLYQPKHPVAIGLKRKVRPAPRAKSRKPAAR